MATAPDVILLRSADEPDPYVRAFAEAGLEAICQPVLFFEFPHPDRLRDHLQKADRYAALVATSPRVGRALAAVFEEHPSLKTKWQGRPAYAVGPKTAQAMNEVGLAPRGADTGSADALADRIKTEAPDAPLLFLAGNRRRDTLPNRLRRDDIAFDELIVYETHTRADLQLPPASWLVFFSPSGQEAIEHSAAVDLQEYRIAAIGPTTASSLREQGSVVEAVADTPSPEGLVSAVTAARDT